MLQTDMPLIKHRPRVKLMLPSEVRAGEPVRGRVELHCRREVEVEHVDVTVVGLQRIVVGSGKSTRARSIEVLRLGARLCDESRLAPGKRELPLAFELPADLLPTYPGHRVNVQYVVDVRVGIDWWPDRRAQFEMCVLAARAPSPEPRPVVYSTRPAGPRADEPFVEVSLASDVAVPGGSVQGALALGNASEAGFERLELALVSVERARIGRASDDLIAGRFAADLGAGGLDGTAVAFTLPIPPLVASSFDTHSGALAWMLEVRAVRRWRSDLSLCAPLTILPAGTDVSGPRAAPPAVGSERVGALWSAIAAGAGLAHDVEAAQLHGTAGEVEVRIRREHRGRDGVHVIGQLRYPSLGIALDISPASGLRKMVSRGVEVGEGWWDARHLVRGREARQVEHVARALRDAVHAFGTIRMDDSEARVEWHDAGQTAEPLRAFVRSVMALAQAIPLARRAIPPPLEMEGALPAWRAGATTLGASLDVGCMAIRAKHAGARAEIVTGWTEDGRPLRTVVALAPVVPLEERVLAYLAAGSAVVGDPARPAGWPLEARALARRLLDGARALEVKSESLELLLDAPIADPAPLVGRLDGLAQLAALLSTGGGPYR